MNLIFFGDEELFSSLNEDFPFAPKIMTTDEEECRDWLETNSSDGKVYLFIDYDLGKKKVDKFLLNLRNEFPELVAVLLYENLKIKELKKHQQGKYAADGYIRKPINKNSMQAVLEDFELGAFISEKNLLEEGSQLPPIPELGIADSAISELNITPLNDEEQEYYQKHGGGESTFFQDEVNQGIQAVFDQVMGTDGVTTQPTSSEMEDFDDEDEFEDDDSMSFESGYGQEEDLENPNVDTNGIGGLNLEEEDEIDPSAGLSFEFNESQAEEKEIIEENNSEEDATHIIGMDQLAAMAAQSESGEETVGSSEQDMGEDIMDQDGDELFEDDLDLDLNEEISAEADEIEKTVVEKYEPAEQDDQGDLDSMDMSSEFDDISIEDASDMIDLDENNNLEMVDEDDDELLSELAGEKQESTESEEKSSEFTFTGVSQEHILPKDEDLEFPSISELNAAAMEDSSAGHSMSDFHVEDFDEDSVDMTLSEIVKTDKLSTKPLTQDDDFDPLEASIGSESSASFEANDDYDDDFELDGLEEENSGLIDISKMDLTDPGDGDELSLEGSMEDPELDDSVITVMEKTDSLGIGEESETTLQFDSSTEQTKERIAVEGNNEPEIPLPEKTLEHTDGAIDQGLVFENVSAQKTLETQYSSPGLMTDGERKLISGHHENELMRLQAMIRQLREEREELLENIQEQETAKKVVERENLGLRAEVDELKIELEIIRKRHRDEMEEIKYRSRISEEKKLLAQEKSKKLDRELSRLQQRIHIDLNKVRQREKELESKLELAMIDSDSQVKARDQKIIELKRKIDQLEFNMENVAMKEQQSRSEKSRIEERLNRIMKTLRGSIELLEDDIQFDMTEKSEE